MNYIIIFNVGAYGHFIGWSLNWLTNKKIPIDERPFENDGSSHSAELLWFKTIKAACESMKSGGIVHPGVRKTHSLKKDIFKLLDHFDRVILLHPTKDSIIWNINNKASKVFTKFGSWFDTKRALELDFSKNLNKWNSNDNLQIWEIREYLSIFVRDEQENEVELSTISELKHIRLFKVPIERIRDDYFVLMDELIEFVGLTRDLSKSLDALYKDWAALQHHMHKDSLTKMLVETILLENSNANMQGLTLLDTAEIQRLLRDEYGLKIKCNGLNEWPATTKELKRLLYKDDRLRNNFEGQG